MRPMTRKEASTVRLNENSAVVSYSGKLPEGGALCHRDDAEAYFWPAWEENTGKDRWDLSEAESAQLILEFGINNEGDVLGWVV